MNPQLPRFRQSFAGESSGLSVGASGIIVDAFGILLAIIFDHLI